MIDEQQVREMLHRRANAVPTIVVDAPKAARQARRRLLANGAIAVLAAAAIAVATIAGVDAIRSAPIPADRPTPSPAPVVLRADGEVLSFTSVPLEAAGDLVAVNPGTGAERVVVEDLEGVYSARWSTDGRWVAYEAPGPDGVGLWVVSTSQEPRQVATNASVWVWSSTGAELAAIQLRSPPTPSLYSGATLSTIDPVTGETTDVGSIPEHGADVTSAPAWSPDRTRFAFGARGGALYSLDVRTGERSLLVRLPGEDLDSVDQIAWSPDGAHIAVMNDLEPGGGRLYVMDADGSNVRVLVDDFDPMGVAWSPDGTRLAYVDGSGSDGAVWVASMDGSAPTEIGSPPAASCAALICDDDLTWSPDGSQLAFRTAGDGSVDVSAISADGLGDPGRIDDLTYRSWDGGWYSCECK
jgi:dipeptidyl aminopeptidase/acylaminoacyl peptidase